MKNKNDKNAAKKEKTNGNLPDKRLKAEDLKAATFKINAEANWADKQKEKLLAN
jgi:hypothetical protein